MDGVGGLTQPHINPGKTFVYEFTLKKSGTFMYHPHADEMVQMAMGMMGFFVIHPRDPKLHRVDRDFVFLLNAFDIDPGAYMPKVMTMTDFNLWAWNTRVFPGIDPLVVRKGDRVRVRIGNLTMTTHPIHMHGYDFAVTCTDGGWVPEERALARGDDRYSGRRHARVRVRRRRARRLGVPLPQVAPHHERHGAQREHLHRRAATRPHARYPSARLPRLHGDGIAAAWPRWASMEMPMPDNTLPMMTGFGPFGPMEMGGMFSVVKVREGLAAGDYKDPGWYAHPPGTVAYELKAEASSAPHRHPGSGHQPSKPAIDLRIKKPSQNSNHRH